MALVNTREASGRVLDYLVALCEGYRPVIHLSLAQTWVEIENARGITEYEPVSSLRYSSTDGAEAITIIDREGIHVGKYKASQIDREPFWIAAYSTDFGPENSCWAEGPTLLIAAMRCYVANKLGEFVEVPDELLTA